MSTGGRRPKKLTYVLMPNGPQSSQFRLMTIVASVTNVATKLPSAGRRQPLPEIVPTIPDLVDEELMYPGDMDDAREDQDSEDDLTGSIDQGAADFGERGLEAVTDGEQLDEVEEDDEDLVDDVMDEEAEDEDDDDNNNNNSEQVMRGEAFGDEAMETDGGESVVDDEGSDHTDRALEDGEEDWEMQTAHVDVNDKDDDSGDDDDDE